MAEPIAGRGTNGYAIASLVLGVIGLTFAPTGPIALWLGYRARRDIERSGQDGSALATAGIVLGWIGTALLVVGLIALVILVAIASSTSID